MILFLFYGCGSDLIKKHLVKHKVGVSRQYSTTDPTFASYVTQFEQAFTGIHKSTMKISNIPINFGTPNEEEFEGVCHLYSNGDKEIIIRKDWWDRVSEEARQLMIFHELGHCVLDRDHKNDKGYYQGREINLSIMSAVLMPVFDYKSFKEEYYYELFTSNHEKLNLKISP